MIVQQLRKRQVTTEDNSTPYLLDHLYIEERDKARWKHSGGIKMMRPSD